jgi:hypothetical protein
VFKRLESGSADSIGASSQFYRHDQGQTGPAQAILAALNLQPMDYGRCCWEAAEILEAYTAGKANGTL